MSFIEAGHAGYTSFRAKEHRMPSPSARTHAKPFQPGEPSDAPAGVVRLSVNLAADVAATLKDNARRKSISITEAIRRAIAVWAFLEEAKREGNRIALIEDLGGGKERLREIVLVD